MNRDRLDCFGYLDEELIAKSHSYKAEPRKSWGRKWVAAVFCVLLGIAGGLGASAVSRDFGSELLSIETEIPEGLTMTILGADRFDASVHIKNDSEFPVIYGGPCCLQKWDGTKWIEVLADEHAIYPSGPHTLQPGEQMYGLCGTMVYKKRLEGSYRFMIELEVCTEEPYPVVLRAEFEVTGN